MLSGARAGAGEELGAEESARQDSSVHTPLPAARPLSRHNRDTEPHAEGPTSPLRAWHIPAPSPADPSSPFTPSPHLSSPEASSALPPPSLCPCWGSQQPRASSPHCPLQSWGPLRSVPAPDAAGSQVHLKDRQVQPGCQKATPTARGSGTLVSTFLGAPPPSPSRGRF